MNLIQQLEEKYGYSGELLAVLKKIVPAMKEYYGRDAEALIDQAILNCEIHVKEKKEDEEKFLQDFFDDKSEKRTLSYITAYYTSKLVKTEEGLQPKRLIYIKSGDDLQHDECIATLIHEICHLVKGYKNEFTIDGNTVIKRTGLGREIHQIDETGKMVITKSENDGLEEALNIYDEEQITSMILGREYISNNYPAIADVTREIMKKPKYKNAFKEALMSGDKTKIKGLSEEEFIRLDELYNNIYLTFFPKWKEIATKEGRKNLMEGRQKYIEELKKETIEEKRENDFVSSLQGLVNEKIEPATLKPTSLRDKQIEEI